MPRWMARRLGWRSAQGLAFFLQAVLLGFAFSAHSSEVWLWVFSAAALINLWAWLVALVWRRAIVDTPTSRVSSAAQGFVELMGVGQPLSERPVLSPFSHLPCLWYRFIEEKNKDGKWRQIAHGESDVPFILDDGSGRCELDPSGAEIVTTHKETRTQGDRRYTEYLLLKGNRLYALGEFVTLNGSHNALDSRRDLGDLLAEWKADQSALHERFDLDRSGVIDDTEWQLARNAAKREVERLHSEIRNQPTRHYLRSPGARKPYLIANYPPEKLGRRYAWLAAAHLALLSASLFGIGWALRFPA